MAAWTLRAAALLMLAALACGVAVFPAPPALLAAALAVYGAVLWYRPALWLLLVPAALPALDFTPWTGWFFLEDLDLLLLATCAVGYWRVAATPATSRLPPVVGTALTLLTLSYAVAAWRGVTPLPPLDANAFSNYTSHYNSLRIFKGLLWPLLLLPLLRRTAGADGEQLRRWFGPGMMLGLALASAALIWERKLFPGLSNFSSDYRPTGAFSAMHTGGAALDAYLAMAFPFVAVWLVGQRSRVRVALGLACFLLGVYSGMTTFSRDIYLAYASAGAVLALLSAGARLRQGSLRWNKALGALALLAVLAWVLDAVFAAGGYRGLAAALGLMASAVVLGGAATRLRHAALIVVLGLALLAAAAALDLLLPGVTGKGAYAGYALAAACCGAGVLLLAGPVPRRTLGLALVAAPFPAIALGTTLVARHWGGNAALAPALLAVALACALAASRWLPRPIWRLNRGFVTLSAFSAIALLVVIPVTSSYYTGVRFANVGGDLMVRVGHWSEALAMMAPEPATQALGMGLGRYPDTYIWANTHGETPGTFAYGAEPGRHFLRLGAPRYAQGYGEVLRMLQRVHPLSGHSYTLALTLRRADDSAALRVGVCERWLIYPQNCVYPPLQVQAGARGWVRYASLIAPKFGQDGLLDRPVQLELSNEGNAALDISDLSLRDNDSGAELIANGDFAAANNHWFFSSDHNHFPWHIKNFFVNMVFETGWLGLAAMALLLLTACGVMLGRALRGELAPAVTLAALTGVMMVGLFDSLTDVPRLTTLMLLLIACGTLTPLRARPAPAQRGRRRRSGGGLDAVPLH
ncbi:hypothetical protein [Rugamonas sp.]|uniref:hypothetical protein n=1 Tax=Rugamonas sp. TaxID=1926287 RepID=UPI0025FEE173|nr:hypothetical protein [Rugamonas sp.]